MVVKTKAYSLRTAMCLAPPGYISFEWLQTKYPQILSLFLKSSLFVFGSGLAIVPFLHGGVVETNHWLSERQFLDAIAVAMITPGPVVVTVASIGYLVGGLAGAVLAGLGVFLPVYLIVLVSASLYRKISKNVPIQAFVKGRYRCCNRGDRRRSFRDCASLDPRCANSGDIRIDGACSLEVEDSGAGSGSRVGCSGVIDVWSLRPKMIRRRTPMTYRQAWRDADEGGR